MDADNLETSDVFAQYANFPFAELPPLVLCKIIVDSGLTISEMHRLCSINRSFRKLCKDASIWKRAFIEKYAKEPGDKRSSADFKAWANDPIAKLWDADARALREYGFTHLLALHYVLLSTRKGNIPFVKKAEGFKSIEVYIELNRNSIRIRDSRGQEMLSENSMAVRVAQHLKQLFGLSNMHYDYMQEVALTVDRAQAVPLVYFLLEDGWVEKLRRYPLQCSICGEQATTQCITCKEMYCGPLCHESK
jgi:hypothetical protein